MKRSMEEDNQVTNESEKDSAERKPWSMKSIAIAIAIFIALFNIYLVLSSGK